MEDANSRHGKRDKLLTWTSLPYFIFQLLIWQEGATLTAILSLLVNPIEPGKVKGGKRSREEQKYVMGSEPIMRGEDQ